MAKTDELERLETALSLCMRVSKRPGYWDEFQRRAKTTIDRPAAAILLLLAHSPCRFQNLVNLLGVEAPSVSRKVHELETDGLIKRQPTQDKRVLMLDLSAEGKELAQRIASAKREVLKEVLHDWSPADRATLTAMLERLAQDLSLRFGSKAKVRF